MFKFTIRDLLWLTVVVALGVGWAMEHRRSARLQDDLTQAEQEMSSDEYAIEVYDRAFTQIEKDLQSLGLTLAWPKEPAIQKVPPPGWPNDPAIQKVPPPNPSAPAPNLPSD